MVVFTDVILFNAVPAINRNGSEWRHLEHKYNYSVYCDLIQWGSEGYAFCLSSNKKQSIIPWTVLKENKSYLDLNRTISYYKTPKPQTILKTKFSDPGTTTE